MENSGSSSRKRSSDHMGSSDDPGDRLLIDFFLPEPKRGRIECRTMENISVNCPIPAPEVMVGSTDHNHYEEPNLDLSLQIGFPRTIQNQRAQFQATAVEDKLAKSEAVRVELARAQEENRFLKEKLSEAKMEHKALHNLLLELTESRSQVGLQGEDEQGGATVSPSSSDRTFSDHDRPSPSNPDQTQPTMKNPRVSVRIQPEQQMKLSNGSPFPRAYGRCSVVKDCSVQKKVQRCAEDPTALITTYEEPHNHVPPLAAVVTANATSAAASTLMSRSSSSAPVTSNHSFLAGATISAAEPVPAVMIDHTGRLPAVAGASELTRDISSDPRVNAAPVSATVITASSEVPQGDGDSKENGKKERSE